MGLIQYDFSPYKKRKLGHTEIHTQGIRPHEDTARGMPSTSQGEEVSRKSKVLTP